MVSIFNSRKTWIRLVFLADQIAFSAANFLLTALLARIYSSVELAAYGIGLSISLMALSLQQNCYLAHNSVLPAFLMRNRARKIIGQHLAFSGFLLAVSLLLLTGLFFAGAEYYILAISASAVVTYLLYSQLGFDRMIMIKHDKNYTPLISSLIFTSLVGVLFISATQFRISYFTLLLIIAGFTIAKACWLIITIGKPDFRIGARLAKRSFEKYFLGSIFGLAGSSGFTHLPLFILGAVAAPIQSAAFVAMRSLTQPLQILIRSMDIVDKNSFQQKTPMTYRDMRTVLLRQLAIYTLFSFAAVIFLYLFGRTIIHLVYGARYNQFANILTGSAIVSALLAVSFPLETGIIKLKQLNRFNIYRIAGGAAGIVTAWFLCKDYGALGAIIASAAGWLVSLFCAIWILRDVFFKPGDTRL